MNEACNGWHHTERVYIQGQSGQQMLVQYVNRTTLRAANVREGGLTMRRGPIKPWAFVPVEDVVWDWEVRRLA